MDHCSFFSRFPSSTHIVSYVRRNQPPTSGQDKHSPEQSLLRYNAHSSLFSATSRTATVRKGRDREQQQQQYFKYNHYSVLLLCSLACYLPSCPRASRHCRHCATRYVTVGWVEWVPSYAFSYWIAKCWPIYIKQNKYIHIHFIETFTLTIYTSNTRQDLLMTCCKWRWSRNSISIESGCRDTSGY